MIQHKGSTLKNEVSVTTLQTLILKLIKLKVHEESENVVLIQLIRCFSSETYVALSKPQ